MKDVKELVMRLKIFQRYLIMVEDKKFRKRYVSHYTQRTFPTSCFGKSVYVVVELIPVQEEQNKSQGSSPKSMRHSYKPHKKLINARFLISLVQKGERHLTLPKRPKSQSWATPWSQPSIFEKLLEI